MVEILINKLVYMRMNVLWYTPYTSTRRQKLINKRNKFLTLAWKKVNCGFVCYSNIVEETQMPWCSCHEMFLLLWSGWYLVSFGVEIELLQKVSWLPSSVPLLYAAVRGTLTVRIESADDHPHFIHLFSLGLVGVKALDRYIASRLRENKPLVNLCRDVREEVFFSCKHRLLHK